MKLKDGEMEFEFCKLSPTVFQRAPSHVTPNRGYDISEPVRSHLRVLLLKTLAEVTYLTCQRIGGADRCKPKVS